jgi:SAM-dependent methyltransferase
MLTANPEQAERWNGADGQHWISAQERYDAMLAPFTDLILTAATLVPGESVLDVGCGCGATTLAAARAVSPGAAVGVDLSAPMLARARAAAALADLPNASFEHGDAQVWSPPGLRFDTVVSRFGMMFFADPVAALANLRGITKARGRLAFTCWQSLAANDWILVPGAALAEHLPLPDPGPPDSPGMFALADPDRIRRILEDAGWREISVTSEQVSVLLGRSPDDAVEFLRNRSAARTVLAGADPGRQARALRAVRDALNPHAGQDGVRLNAAVWVVKAAH